MGLIGLLTYAFGRKDPSAITVAGQWRIRTALPVHQTEKFIDPRLRKVKHVGSKEVWRALRAGDKKRNGGESGIRPALIFTSD